MTLAERLRDEAEHVRSGGGLALTGQRLCEAADRIEALEKIATAAKAVVAGWEVAYSSPEQELLDALRGVSFTAEGESR